MKLVRRLLPQPVLSLVIVALWLGLAGSVSVGQVLLGALLGLLLPRLTQSFWPDRPRLARPVAGVRLVAVVLFDIVVANWQVARRVLGPSTACIPASSRCRWTSRTISSPPSSGASCR